MNKLLLIGIIFSSNVFAGIYCPDSIVCSTQGDISSCKMVGGSSQYWGNIGTSGPVQATTYKFMNAYGVYAKNPNDPEYFTMCTYIESSGKFSETISVAPINNNLVAHVDNINGWYVNGYSASCSGNVKSTDCPFDLYVNKPKN